MAKDWQHALFFFLGFVGAGILLGILLGEENLSGLSASLIAFFYAFWIGFLIYSKTSIWKKIGITLAAVLLFLPIYACSSLMYADSLAGSSPAPVKPVALEGKLSFLNPSLTTVKSAFLTLTQPVTTFLASSLMKVIGLRTMMGELRCTYFFRYAWIGLWVCLWIFLGFLLTGLSQYAKAKGQDEEDIESIPDMISWRLKCFFGQTSIDTLNYKRNMLEFLGDKWWKYILFALIYTYIMSFIPFVNQIFRILTLEIFQPNWFIQSLIIVFEVAFLPMWAEQYRLYRKRQAILKQKLAKKVYEKANEAWFGAK